MRPLFSILIPCMLLALPMAMSAQPTPDTTQWPEGRPGENFNVKDDQGRKQGRWIRVYPDGRLYYSGTFKDDRPVDHFTFFRENGRVLTEIQHDTENDMAKAILYREDGTPSHQGQYRTLQENGEWTQRKEGLWEALDPQGRLRIREHYMDDVLDGPQQTFHPNGNILEEGQYRAGEKTGEWKTYDREGQLLNREMWREGNRHGESTTFQERGAPLSVGQYESGAPVGEWTTYNPDGKERSKVTYEGGRPVKEAPLNGSFDANYPSGRPEWVARYAHGRLDGPFTAWHDLGEWVMTPAEEGAGNPGGPPIMGGGGPGGDAVRRELRNQPMKEMGEYTAGVKDGTWRYYDEQGEVIRTERWNLGRLQSTED